MKQDVIDDLKDASPITMNEFIQRCDPLEVEILTLEDQFIPASRGSYPIDVLCRKVLLKYKGKKYAFKTIFDFDLFRG